MAGYERLVKEVLRNPYEIRTSTLYNTGAAFISESGILPEFPQGIRVLVKYDDASYEKGSTEGIVTTAYPVDHVNFQRPNLGRTLYRKK